VIKPLLKLLLLLITRTPDGPANPYIEGWFRTLQEFIYRFPKEQWSKEREILVDMKAIETILTELHKADEAKRRAKERSVQFLEEQLQLSNQLGEFIPLELEPGPGDTNPYGPRHNNDNADYRQIKVLPTQEEILCELAPYLPKRAHKLSFIASPVDLYLDSQFRLLREDMLASVRRGIQRFFAENALTTMQSGAYKYNTKAEVGPAGSASSDSVTLAIFRDIEIESLRPLLYKGLCFEVSFAQPELISKMKLSDRQAFWEQHAGSRMLEVGSLVGLALGMNKGKSPTDRASSDQLFFATVVDREKIGNLHKDPKRCRIILSLLDDKTTVNLAAWLASPEQRKTRNKESVMLQVRGHFFAGYEPVLTTLKVQHVTTIPFLQTLVGKDMDDGYNPALLPPPSLVNKQLDLSPILKKEFSHHKLSLEIQEFDRLKDRLRAIEELLILDKTQIDAFALALTRQVSLIQGPPGTGKTYVGIQIVRALLHNSVGHYGDGWVRQAGAAAPQPRRATGNQASIALDPILCICYTNHALDQFLEGLAENGVPLDRMVRVGGRSKSEKLESRNLVKLTSLTKTKAEYKDWKSMRTTAEDLERAIDRYSKMKSMSNLSWDFIAKWVEENYPDHYHRLLKKKEEGFTIVGGEHFIVMKQWLKLKEEQEEPKTEEEDKKKKEKKGKKNRKDRKERRKEKEAKKKAKEEQRKREEEERTNTQPQEDEDGDENEEVRSIEELLEDGDVWGMNPSERWKLWNSWKEEFIKEQDMGLPSQLAKYTQCLEKHREIDETTQLRVLKQAAIVGFTTSGSAKYQKLLRALNPKVIICEEAGEVLESHIVAALTPGTEQLILIGDHKQLRPKLSEYTLSIDSRSGYDLDVSLFERLVNENEKEKALALRPGSSPPSTTLVTLDTQRRMRPDIADLVRLTLYPKLLDSPAVTCYPEVQGFQHNLWFFTHENRENSDSSNLSVTTTSKTNEFEADFIVQLVKYTVRQGYKPDEIAVLTPYVGQLLLLRKKLSTANIVVALDERDLQEIEAKGGEVDDQDNGGEIEEQRPTIKTVSLNRCIRLATVDNFQGEEAKVVIISTVRNNVRGRTGFLKIENRVNVMLSRAKHGMYILGSKSTLEACKGAKMFNSVLRILQQKGVIGSEFTLQCKNHRTVAHIRTPLEFHTKAPYGGCQLPCGQRLKCGHACTQLCHPDSHEQIQCWEPCAKTLPCGHRCSRLCYQDCGQCDETIPYVHTCGHTLQLKCHQLQQSKKHCLRSFTEIFSLAITT
jgi:hypothetical protein